MSNITQAERTKYAEIFQARGQVNGYMSGAVVRDVLLSSNLPPDRLEHIWDLADIDKDGNLDFEEFCIAMHLTFDCINGIEAPHSLPPGLVPPQKTHLLQNQMTGVQQPQMTGYQQPQMTGYQQPQQTGYLQPHSTHSPSMGSQYSQSSGLQPQSTGFSLQNSSYSQPTGPSSYSGYKQTSSNQFTWDMTPQDFRQYEDIYEHCRSKRPNRPDKLKFEDMDEYYKSLESLGVGRIDLSEAWTLVNVGHKSSLTKDQCLLYLHILNQRKDGAQIPKDLPDDLKKSFLGDRPGAGYESPRNKPSKSAQLADSYINRLGTASTYLGTKESTTLASKYDEEEMLKRELDDLKKQVEEAEQQAKATQTNERDGKPFSSWPLKDQFQALLDYKTRQLADQSNLGEKIRKQEKSIDQAKDAVRRLERIRDDLRDKKGELESLLNERRLEVQKVSLV